MIGSYVTESPTRADEAKLVEGWRTKRLAEAGYPLELAEQIARSSADLHLACDLVSRGCAPELAAQILL